MNFQFFHQAFPKYWLACIFMALALSLSAQQSNNTYLDTRDGQTYKTTTIGNTVWFQTNLRYESANAFCPHVAKTESSCDKGNYYGYVDKETVCPAGWRLPTIADWQQYFLQRLEAQGGSIFDVKVDTLMEEFLSLVHTDSKGNVKLFGQDNPLGLEELNWVEGKKIREKGSTTFWVNDTALADKRFHLHLSDKTYVFHRHAHNLEDKPRRKRKFLVKCVQEAGGLKR